MTTYRRNVLCPSCGAIIDVSESPSEDPDGMASAMLFGDSRREHAEKSPECRNKDGWYRGWDFGPVEKID